MSIKTFIKQPADIEVYEIDWSANYLAGANDTAGNLLAFTADSGVTVTPEIGVGSPVSSGVLRVRVEGGTNGQSYKVTARLGTAGGREKEAEILVQVVET